MFNIFLLAVGLAMDSFGVSLALGSQKKRRLEQGIISSLMFGIFQALMPVFGLWGGKKFSSLISGFDHWIAFLFLLVIGVKMIYRSFDKEKLTDIKRVSSKTLFSLAFATSIDALVVGISMAFFTVSIILAVGTIGIITFLLSLGGFLLGKRCYQLFQNKTGLIGGFILIFIGIKILISHLS